MTDQPSILPINLQRRLYYQAMRGHFLCFLRQVFHTLNPSQPFIPNWHLEAIHEYLTALDEAEISRLIINMPPRSLKSLSVTVAWTAFLLGRNPASKIITASYSSAISIKHALDVRALVAEDWFRQSFPAFQVMAAQNEKHKFLTTQHGFRLATSVGGSLTGEGGDVIIVDDPLNPMQAASHSYRNRANHWFDSTLSSRLNDKRHGKMLVVMQRLHEQDLTGHLLQKGGWEHLCLPALAEMPLRFTFGGFHKEMRAGEYLQPEREGEAVLARLRQDLGSMAFAAQYLQQPVSSEGHLVRREWLHEVEQLPANYDLVLQSWDTAIKAGSGHDASACVTIGVAKGMAYVLDVQLARLDYPALRRMVVAMAEQHKPDAMLIEDKASGQSLLQELRNDTALPVVAIMPKGDKLQRLAAVTPMLEAQRVVFPAYAAWKEALFQELLNFPHGKHDDQVDALSQALHWLRLRQQTRERFIRII